MKLVPLLALALVACKSHKAAAPAAGSAAAVAPVSARAATPAPAAAPQLPTYTAPEVPEGEVAPAQAEGSAVAPAVVAHDPISRAFDKLDANHDGKLTPDEVKKRLGDDVDTNGDGEISKDELAEGMRAERIRVRAGATR